MVKLANKAGFPFVELSGDIGILANGAGLTMVILIIDIVIISIAILLRVFGIF